MTKIPINLSQVLLYLLNKFCSRKKTALLVSKDITKGTVSLPWSNKLDKNWSHRRISKHPGELTDNRVQS